MESGWLGQMKQRMFYSPLIPCILNEVRECRQALHRLSALETRIKHVQEALGRVEARQTANETCNSLQDCEFKVFSQWGEDGIIQHLVSRIAIPRKVFVEFGVESYEEANTRFLLVNNNWSGLVLDSSPDHVARIRKSREYWLYNLKAAEAFVTRDNINRVLGENGIAGEIGLLSIDIDGMDYWIWKEIDIIQPAIVIMEYNHRFGPEQAVTVPYGESFDRRREHHSLIYYGASLKALELLGSEKGYALVGCGSAGLNAFFVRRDVLPAGMQALTAEAAFVAGQFCESHDEMGRRVKLNAMEEAELLMKLPVENVNGKHSC